MEQQPAQVSFPSDRVVEVTRSFRAPRALVYEAYTTPELLKRWLLGPPGWTMPVCEMDVRAGGAYRWRWRSDEDGSEFGFHGTFLVHHWLGNEGMPRRYADYLPTDGFTTLNTISSIFAFVLGTAFGSFANVCIYRLPEGLSIATPASRCGACGTPIRWYDNLPIFSYLLLRGRCRDCGAAFSARYLFVEVATGMLFGSMLGGAMYGGWARQLGHAAIASTAIHNRLRKHA